MEFVRELSWQCYNKHQLSVNHMDGILVYKYGVEMRPKPDETPLIYFAADTEIKAFDCDRDEFVGSYRSEENPQAVENGRCTNSELAGGDPCFALEIPPPRPPGGGEREQLFFRGGDEGEGTGRRGRGPGSGIRREIFSSAKDALGALF